MLELIECQHQIALLEIEDTKISQLKKSENIFRKMLYNLKYVQQILLEEDDIIEQYQIDSPSIYEDLEIQNSQRLENLKQKEREFLSQLTPPTLPFTEYTLSTLF